MPIAPGTRLGPYEISAALGAGGMGEVYRARDTRLDRDVAVKVLPPQVAADPALRQRFEREARAVAALNHPHICVLHDVGRHADTDFLVMELLDGRTLADRLVKGPLPLAEALRYATEIADALKAAHRAGIVHRDLKPGNVMLTAAGVKLLDFGLAKATGTTASPAGVSALPTAMPTTPAVTTPGMVLGTFQYMAPEQVEGQDVDARADLFAFGAVLYEMLTGQRAFEGKSAASVMAAILEREPPAPSSIQALAPRALDRVVGRCLAKNREERWQTAADLLAELEWIAHEPGAVPVAAASTSSSSRARGWSVAAASAVAGALITAGVALFLRGADAPPALPEIRLELQTPQGTPISGFSISPDGRYLAYVGGFNSALSLRALDSETARPVAGTESAAFPFWSPDGTSLAFFASDKGLLMRVDLETGFVRPITKAYAATGSGGGGGGGTWNRDQVILFNPSQSGPIYRVSAAGGDVSEATKLTSSHREHRFPVFLPDGRRFVFFARTREGQGIYLASLDSPEPRHLLESDGAAVFSPPDRLLYTRRGVLLAQRIDVNTVDLVGEPMTVAQRVAMRANEMGGTVALAASASGVVAYRSGAERRQLVLVDRSGKEIRTFAPVDDSQLRFNGAGHPVSPDGRSAVVMRTIDGEADLWLLDLDRGTLRRLTSGPAVEHGATWSPDGKELAFASTRSGVSDIYRMAVDNPSPTLVVESADPKGGVDWSPDGKYLSFQSVRGDTSDDLWAVRLEGDGKPFPVSVTPFFECCGRFSPDGRWIAYRSGADGSSRVYVQPFPGPGPRVQLPTDTATTAQWRADGRELYTTGRNGGVVAVPIDTSGPQVEIGTPVDLFSRPFGQFQALPDGQRFLRINQLENAPPITILLNWRPKP